MKKPLAGRRAFEAMGRRAQSQGIPCVLIHAIGRGWPHWAREAWATGYVRNASFKAIYVGHRRAAQSRVKRVTRPLAGEVAATGASRSSTASEARKADPSISPRSSTLKRSTLLNILLMTMLPMRVVDDSAAASISAVDPATAGDQTAEVGTTDAGETTAEAGTSAANADASSQADSTSSTADAANATGTSTGDAGADAGEPSSSGSSSDAGTADAAAAGNTDAGSATSSGSASSQAATNTAADGGDTSEAATLGEGVASDAGNPSASDTPSSASSASTDGASPVATGAAASDVYPHAEATGIVARLREAMLKPVETVIDQFEADLSRLETLLEHLKNV